MKDLIQRIEQADGPSPALDEEIMALRYRREERFIGTWEDDGIDQKNVRRVKDKVWVDPATDKWVSTHALPFTRSIDDAMRLVSRDYFLKLEHRRHYDTGERACVAVIDLDREPYTMVAWAKTFPLALTAVGLKLSDYDQNAT